VEKLRRDGHDTTKAGHHVISRLMGLGLAAIGVQFMLMGLVEALPRLKGAGA
jgi:small neutral amino acid transporter SnatA (MarC family)